MKAMWIGGAALGLALGLWVSCGGDDSGTPDGGDTAGGDGDTAGGCVRTDECHQGFRCNAGTCVLALPALDELPADLSCVGDNPPIEPLGTTVSATVYVEDFEDEVRVEGAVVEIFLDNIVDDTPDLTTDPTDENGEVPGGVAGLPARGVIAYLVHAGDLPGGMVRTTIEYDVEIPDADGGEVRLLSVSDTTYRLIPTVLGITPDASHGIIAGEFGDCAADPVSVEGIVARLVNAAGEDCHELNDRECYSRYFQEETPARIDSQPYSSADGLYAIAQVAPGPWDLQVLGRLTAAATDFPFDLLGQKRVNCIADSIVIVDVNPLAEPVP
ncbi:MAG: hypothetical protein HY905_00505 [Deltaproteobacteria bacterium]|nr:hypothetical protein [Deltaproteobacteria bacterium]